MYYKRRKRMFNKWKRKGKGGKFNNFKRAKTGRPSKGLTMSKYFFKRCMTEVRDSFDAASSGRWYTNVLQTETSWYQQFTLNQLHNATDFTTLFAQYRINAVKVELIPQATSIPQGNRGAGLGLGAEFSQLVAYVMPNPHGQFGPTAISSLSEQICLDAQYCKKRKWINGKPFKIYTKTNQLGMVYASTVNTDYVKIKPRLLSTNEIDTPHYGLSILFVNQNGGTLPVIPCKIITTFYIECRGAM